VGEFAFFVIAVFVFVAVTIAKGVRIVPQGEEWIVERLGKYHTTLRPGLNIIIPYFDQVRYKLVTKDIILDVQEQEVITKDNAVILTNAIAVYQGHRPDLRRCTALRISPRRSAT